MYTKVYGYVHTAVNHLFYLIDEIWPKQIAIHHVSYNIHMYTLTFSSKIYVCMLDTDHTTHILCHCPVVYDTVAGPLNSYIGLTMSMYTVAEGTTKVRGPLT